MAKESILGLAPEEDDTEMADDAAIDPKEIAAQAMLDAIGSSDAAALADAVSDLFQALSE